MWFVHIFYMLKVQPFDKYRHYVQITIIYNRKAFQLNFGTLTFLKYLKLKKRVYLQIGDKTLCVHHLFPQTANIS